MSKVCLVIIFNHRYDKNIDLLEKIYQDRFSNRYYIVPFYDGDRERVIPVYECSFRFSGYVAQAYPYFKGDYDHYLFVADDIIMNPLINENNYEEWYKVDKKTSFITWRKALGDLEGFGFGRRFMDPLPVLEWYNGTNWKNEIMPAEAAFEIAQKQGWDKNRFVIGLSHVWNNRKSLRRYPRLFVLFFKILLLGKQQIPYPVWGGYSDLFVIPGDRMKEIAHMMGVFAGMNLYVEIAIPTAISLLSEQVSVQDDLDCKPLLLWTKEERDGIIEKHGASYDSLEKNWDPKDLFIHPIKLSQWK